MDFPKKILKQCKTCQERKWCRWMSTFSSSGKPEYKARCDDCHNEYARTRAKLPHRKIASTLQRRKLISNRKQYALKRLGGKCSKCGYNKCIAALTFHHKNPKHKIYSVPELFDYSIKNLNKELRKCVLLCFNCHMEYHWSTK